MSTSSIAAFGAGFDPAKCPLCGAPNQCALAADLASTQCWCESVEFPAELLAQIPGDAVRKTCVCKSCLEQFQHKAG